MHINITDKEHIYGSNVEEIQSYTLSELNKMEGTFKYIEGHSYLITAMHSIYNEEKGAQDIKAEFVIADWVGGGSSITGYNRIEDGELSISSIPTSPIEIILLDENN